MKENVLPGPVTDAEMKATLTRNRFTARCTAAAELWYGLGWSFGLPLGIAYMDLMAKFKRQQRRMGEMQALQRQGWRYDRKRAGWYHESNPTALPLTRQQALEQLK